MARFGILSCGLYVPRRRIARAAIFEAVGWAQPSLKGLAKGARAFGAWDEDPITMGVEAARMATASAAAPLDAVCFASTTAPFLDRQNAGVVAAALDLPSNAQTFDASGSQRAASSALIRLAAGRDRAALLVAAERRPTKPASLLEMTTGDLGAAALLGEGDPIAEIVATRSVYADFVDHYRTEQSGVDYVLEERWWRDEGLGKLAPAAVSPLLESAGAAPKDIDRLIAPLANPKLAEAVARAIGVDVGKLADPLAKSAGYGGSAHALAMLAVALEEAAPGDLILLTTFGQGCDAILLRVGDKPAGERSARRVVDDMTIEENYTRFLSASGALDIDWGMRAERDNRTAQSVAYNKSRDTYGFVGGYCQACGTPQFPKSRRCVNPNCNALDSQTDYRFAYLSATIKTYTEDWLAFTREPPLIYGNVNFVGGGAAFLEMCEFGPGEAFVGAPVEMRFRIKDFDERRGFRRYFWKAGPARGGGDG